MIVAVYVLLAVVLTGWMVDRWRMDRDRRIERASLVAAILARTPHELTTAVRQVEPSLATPAPKPRRRRRADEPDEPQIPVGL